MPFTSEKQRRFLWAAHPDIAKRWAHEYPNKKKLPMYAHKTDTDTPQDEKAKKVETNHKHSAVKSVALDIYAKFKKKSAVTEVRVAMPQGDKPTYAGQEATKVKETKKDLTGCGNMPKNDVSRLMAKLSAVLSQPIQQALENERAEQEARDAALMPANAGIKRYAMPAAGTPLPMGMQPQAPQAPQQAPAQPAPAQAQANGQLPPVGGGSSPNANPINSFGALSSSGDINGNASLGTQNMAGGEKLSGVLSGLGQLFGRGAKAVANTAASAAKRVTKPALNIATVHPSAAGPLAAARGESLMQHPDIAKNVWKWSNMPKRTAQPPATRMRMPGAAPGGFPRFGDTQQAQLALADAQARFERAQAGLGRRYMSATQTGANIRSGLTAFGGPTTDAQTWGQLQGIAPAAAG